MTAASAVLVRGFPFDGVRVPLVGPQGIFKPAVLSDAERPMPSRFAAKGVFDDTHREGLTLPKRAR